MTLSSQVIAASGEGSDSGRQLFTSIVVVLIFVPIFWGMRKKVKAGKLAPLERRTNPHSRTYLVVIASLNVVIVVFFLVAGVLAIANGDLAWGVSSFLLAGLIATFVWMIFRQGSELRREGRPDQAPSEAQKKLSRPRRSFAFAAGGVSGVVGFGTINAAYEREWSYAIIGAVVALAAFGVAWWLQRPLRESAA